MDTETIVNEIYWFLVDAPEFPYRRPKRMLGFSIEPRLDWYEVAGTIPPLPYDRYREMEEMQPYGVPDEETEEPIVLKNIEIQPPQPKSILPSCLRPIIQDEIRCLSCRATPIQAPTITITPCQKENQPIQTLPFRNNYTGRKKHKFWQLWLQMRQKTNSVPPTSFEQNFNKYRYCTLQVWREQIQRIFNE